MEQSSLGYMGRYLRQDSRLYEAGVKRLGAALLQEVKFPDLSFYNGKPNFDIISNWTKGVIVRVGQGPWPDTEFARNYAEAKRVGLVRGVYWFYDDRYSPESQATLLLSFIKNQPPEMEIFIDWENTYGGSYSGINNIIKMMKIIESEMPGCRVGIYTGYYWFKDHATLTSADSTYLKNTALWLAWYTSNPSYVQIPAPWTKITHWQYGTPAMSGVPGECDMNWYNGTISDFTLNYGVVTPPPPVDVPVQTHNGVTYYAVNRFGAKCFVHIFDLSKVRIFVTPGPFQTVSRAIDSYHAQGGFNGGGWPNVQTDGHRANEIWASEGTILQATALDDRGYINVSKDNKIKISGNDILAPDLWNTWGYDRLLGINGVFNEAISDRTTKDARTVSGFTADGKLVIVVAEGNDRFNIGLTFPECWSVLKEFGVVTGGNNDGGSSTTAINKAIQPTILNYPSDGTDANVINQVLFFADDIIVPPPPDGGDMKQFIVIMAVRPRSQPTMTTTDQDPLIPAGTTFDSDRQEIDQITSSHPTMVHIASGPWSGKWIPLVYLDKEYCRDITQTPTVTLTHVIKTFSDGSVEVDGVLITTSPN